MDAASQLRCGVRHVRQHWAWSVVLTLLAALAVSVGYVVLRAPRPSAAPVATLSEPIVERQLGELRLPPPPPALPTHWLADLRRQHGLPNDLASADSATCRRLHDALASDPWVASVADVAPDPTGGVTVSLTFRRPVAWVMTTDSKQRRYLVDASGRALATDKDQSVAPSLRIVGVHRPPERLGQPWGDSGVVAAARAATEHGEAWEKLGLRRIRLGADPLIAELRLETEQGTQVIWERLDERDELPAPEVRLTRLQRYVTEYGSLDQPAGPYVLDVRHGGGLRRQQVRRE